MADDATLSRQHSVPSRRCRVRDLSLERHSPMKDRPSQQPQLHPTMTNGRIRATQPPAVPQDYYGIITNHLNPGKTERFFH